MADFRQSVPEPEAQNFLGYSRGPGVNKTFGALFEGIGNVAVAAATAVDEKNKSDIYNEVDNRVTNTRALFGVDSMSNVAAGTGVPDGPSDVPPGLKNSSDYLARLQTAYQQGTIRESHYYGQLNNIVKDMRLKYPGYNEIIDNTVQKIAGVNPANAIVSTLRDEAAAAKREADSEGAKWQTYVDQNQEVIKTAFPDYYQNPDKYTKNQVREGVATIGAQDANVNRMIQQINLENESNTLTKTRAADTYGKIAAVVTNQFLSGALNSAAGGSWNEVVAKVQKAQSTNTPLSPEDTTAILNAANAAKLQITQKMSQIALQDGFSSTLDKKARDEATAAATAQVDSLIEAVTNKDYGLVTMNAAWIKASQDSSTAQILKDNPVLNTLKSIQDTGGQAAVGTFLANNQQAMNELSTIVVKNALANTASNPNLDINDELKRNSGYIADPSTGVTSKANNYVIDDHISALVDPKAGKLSENAAQRLFSNNGGLNLAGINPGDTKITGNGSAQDRVFAKLTSPEVTKRMQQIAQDRPDLWSDYVNWATKGFATRTQSIAGDLKQRLEAFPALAQTLRPFYDAKTGKLVVTERPFSGDTQQQDLPIANQAKEFFMNDLRSLNVALSGMKPILDANGGDSAKQMEQLLKIIGVPLLPDQPTGSDPTSRQETNDLQTSLDPIAPEMTGRGGVVQYAATELGVDPLDLATAISYETNGSFRTDIMGGKGGQYLGLIQFGPEEQKMYGAAAGQSFEEQMGAVVRYLKDRGVTPGMSLMDIYSTINAGSPGRYDASDRPGKTVRTHVRDMSSGLYRQRAQELLLSTSDQ